MREGGRRGGGGEGRSRFLSALSLPLAPPQHPQTHSIDTHREKVSCCISHALSGRSRGRKGWMDGRVDTAPGRLLSSVTPASPKQQAGSRLALASPASLPALWHSVNHARAEDKKLDLGGRRAFFLFGCLVRLASMLPSVVMPSHPSLPPSLPPSP